MKLYFASKYFYSVYGITIKPGNNDLSKCDQEKLKYFLSHESVKKRIEKGDIIIDENICEAYKKSESTEILKEDIISKPHKKRGRKHKTR